MTDSLDGLESYVEILRRTGQGYLFPSEVVLALAEPLRRAGRVGELEDAIVLLQSNCFGKAERIEELEAALRELAVAVTKTFAHGALSQTSRDALALVANGAKP